jgi:esterase
VAVDLPGHGDSGRPPEGDYAPDALAERVVETADDLGLERFTLVGHSFGGGVAQWVAGRLGDRVTGLLLADPAGDHRGERDEIEDFVEEIRGDGYAAGIRAFWEEILEGATATTRERVLEDLRATPREAVVRGLSAMARHDPRYALEGYGGPVLVVTNPRFDQPSSLHRVMPELPAVELADASHWFHLDRPDAFGEILVDFLGTAEGRAGG